MGPALAHAAGPPGPKGGDEQNKDDQQPVKRWAAGSCLGHASTLRQRPRFSTTGPAGLVGGLGGGQALDVEGEDEGSVGAPGVGAGGEPAHGGGKVDQERNEAH